MDASPSRQPHVADPLRRLWSPITIRVAWELVRAGVRVKPATLRAAREHALWRIPPRAGIAEAEVFATAAVEEYLARVNGRYARVEPDPDVDILPNPGWREAIVAAAEPLHDAILRLHYADGFPFDEVQRRFGLSEPIVRAAREAVRELARSVLSDDGVSTIGWDNARLDRLIVRIANAAGDNCPGPGGLGTDAGRAHGEHCPRCSRALRLFREGALSPSDLFPPEGAPCLPADTIDIACILVHPDARKHLRLLMKAFPDARKIGEEAILLAGDGLEAALHELAEAGTPPAAHLRIARRTAPGRWTDRAVLGPAPELVRAEAVALAWGEVRGIAKLPQALPPPPSAARWWSAAVLGLLVAGAAGAYAALPSRVDPDVGLSARIDRGMLVFDVDDAAFVDVLVVRGLSPALAFHSETAGDKGALSTGDGRYRLVDVAAPARAAALAPAADPASDVVAPATPGPLAEPAAPSADAQTSPAVTAPSAPPKPAWIIVAAPSRLDDTAIVAQAATDIDDAIARLRARYPGAAVRLVR